MRSVSSCIAIACVSLFLTTLQPGCGGSKPKPSSAKNSKAKAKSSSAAAKSTTANSSEIKPTGGSSAAPSFSETPDMPRNETPAARPEPPSNPVASPVADSSVENPIPGKPVIKADGGLRDIVWTRDGRRVATIAYDRLICVNVQTGAIERTPNINAGQMALSPDEQTVAVTTENKTIEFRSFAELAKPPKAKTVAQNEIIQEIVFSPDGTGLYSAMYGASTIQVWNPADGALIKEMPVDNLKIHLMAAAPQGDLIALSGEIKQGEFNITRKLWLWDAKTGKLKHELDNLQPSRPEALTFSPDGKLLAVGADAEPSIRLWDTESGKMVKELLGHGKEVRTLAFFPDGKRLASGSADQTVRIWDLQSGESQAELIGSPGALWSVAVAPQIPWIVSGDSETIRFWDIDEAIKNPAKYSTTGEETRNWNAHSGGGLWHIDVSHDGSHLVSHASEGIKLWDVESGKVLKKIPCQIAGAPPVAISPDGTQFACIDGYQKVSLYAIPSGELQHTLTHENGTWSRQLLYTPDGRRLILAGEKNLLVWDLETRALLKTWQGGDTEIESMAITNDGKRLATGTKSGKLTFWDIDTFESQKTIEAGSNQLLAIGFNSDDSLMATVSLDDPLQIWNVATGNKTVTYKVNSSRIDTLMFIPGTNVVVIPSSDESYSRSVWLVNAVTGKRVKPLKGHSDTVMSVRFMPKQNQIVTADMAGSIKFWTIDPAKLK